MSIVVSDKRVRLINDGEKTKGSVIYWMSRDQRANDNWALLYAQQTALENESPLIVLFNLVPGFLGAGLRQYDFMIKGLAEIEKTLNRYKIPFYMSSGAPSENIPDFIEKHKASILVTDYSPLKINKNWKKEISARIDIPMYEVDAHNIVPVWIASQKQEFAAYTIRPKINRLLPEFLTDMPSLKKHPFSPKTKTPAIDWNKIHKNLTLDKSVAPVTWLKPGEKAAAALLKKFLENKLDYYDDRRNDPNTDAQSDMSPYIHFGQISAQRIALELQSCDENIKSQEAYLEQLIIRRELADNFCEYNPNYDNFDGFPDWAKATLDEHRADPREYNYDRDTFERAETHDELWNAAQMEMVLTGKMHGYMRMYWAKKILEWTAAPDEAMNTAVYLNDKYELDGRDPNGYTGTAWSIGGVHDRPWFERDIFGKIRFMSYNGCKRKFDIKQYVSGIEKIKEGKRK